VELRGRIAETLREYEKRLPEFERAAFLALRMHVDSYWRSLTPALEWGARARRSEGGSYLRIVVQRRRQEVVQLARQVTALNENDLNDRGGSNGSRVRLWRREPQKITDETGLAHQLEHTPMPSFFANDPMPAQQSADQPPGSQSAECGHGPPRLLDSGTQSPTLRTHSIR
jgi:hypothetical protein